MRICLFSTKGYDRVSFLAANDTSTPAAARWATRRH